MDIILVKNILLYAEENLHTSKNMAIQLKGYTSEEISYCIKKLDENGFVKVVDLSDTAGIEFRIVDITTKGYDLISWLRATSNKQLLKSTRTYNDLNSPPINSQKEKRIRKSDILSFVLIKVVPGLIVSAIAIFFFTPLKEAIFPDKINSKRLNQKSIESNEQATNNNQQNDEAESETKSKINIENMSGGIAIGNVENFNIHQNFSPPRDPSGIYKEGVKWGSVINFKIENNQKSFTIDKIEFDKPIQNVNDLFTPFEYKEYLIKIEKIETVVQVMPPSAEGINGKIVGKDRTE